MRYLLGELLAAYGLIDKFDIQFDTLVRFADQLEFGYNLHSNPYHNSLHACDVLQTTHYHIHASGISNWLSEKCSHSGARGHPSWSKRGFLRRSNVGPLTLGG
ncbi:unnamed protein product, partial [Oikopleura dioica]